MRRTEEGKDAAISRAGGATLAGGGLAVTMRNQKGVELNLVGMTQGLHFKFSGDGVKFTLSK